MAGRWQLENCEDPSFVIRRPYKLLPPMSQVRSPLAAPWPQRGRRASSWSCHCSRMRQRASGRQDSREMKEGWHMRQCHKNGMTLVALYSQVHPGYLRGSREPTSGIFLTSQESSCRSEAHSDPPWLGKCGGGGCSPFPSNPAVKCIVLLAELRILVLFLKPFCLLSRQPGISAPFPEFSQPSPRPGLGPALDDFSKGPSGGKHMGWVLPGLGWVLPGLEMALAMER